MNTLLAYLVVLVIWATTPLAIHWSNAQLDFVTALSARVVLAAVVGLVIAKMLRIRIIERVADIKHFVIGALGLFPTMHLVYFAAQAVPSGMMSVLFGVFPLMVGVLSQWMLREQVLSSLKLVAIALALLGLSVLNLDQLRMGGYAFIGVMAMLLATFLWALSAVWLKSLVDTIAPFRQSVGTLLVSAPVFALAWIMFGDPIPRDIGMQSSVGVVYLAVAGSLLGHTLFFYILQRCAVLQVSLIPLMTPIFAIFLGIWVEGESFSNTAFVGVTLLLLALALYQDLPRYLLTIAWRARISK